MRVLLLGYGRMGKLIETLAPEVGVDIAGVVNDDSSPIPTTDFDVAIEFTEPGAVLGNARRVADLGKDLVIGTTGWGDQLDSVRMIAEQTGIGIVYASNFSVGVNLFCKMVDEAAHLMRNQPDYEAWAYEIHHSEKKDAPSGTLLSLVDTMRESGYTGNVDVASNRAGRVPGTHTIGFDSAVDSITLTHTARNREGFARGAMLAAKRIHGKSGLHRFVDLL